MIDEACDVDEAVYSGRSALSAAHPSATSTTVDSTGRAVRNAL